MHLQRRFRGIARKRPVGGMRGGRAPLSCIAQGGRSGRSIAGLRNAWAARYRAFWGPGRHPLDGLPPEGSRVGRRIAPSSVAVIVLTPHLAVVALEDMGAGVRAIAVKGVVARDLLRAEQRRRREMAGQVDEAQLRTGGLSDERTQAGLVEIAGAEGCLDRFFRRDQPGARLDGRWPPPPPASWPKLSSLATTSRRTSARPRRLKRRTSKPESQGKGPDTSAGRRGRAASLRTTVMMHRAASRQRVRPGCAFWVHCRDRSD